MKIPDIHKVYEKFSAFEQKVFIILAALGIIGLLGVLGHAYNSVTREEPAYGGELIEGVVGQPTSLNPLSPPKSDADLDLRALVHGSLITVNGKGDFIPMLAAGLPEVSQDLKVYTIKLQEHLFWQDGKPITADDVIYTINNIQDKDGGSYLRNAFRFVQVEKIDDLTVQFKLREASVTFLENLLLSLMPKSASGGYDNLHPISAGPYRIKKYHYDGNRKVTKVDLVANENFKPHPPYIKKLSLKFFDSENELIQAYNKGEITSFGLLRLPDFLKASNDTTKTQISLPQYQAVLFNQEKSEILRRGKERQALAHGSDRARIAKIFFTRDSGRGTQIGTTILCQLL